MCNQAQVFEKIIMKTLFLCGCVLISTVSIKLYILTEKTSECANEYIQQNIYDKPYDPKYEIKI